MPCQPASATIQTASFPSLRLQPPLTHHSRKSQSCHSSSSTRLSGPCWGRSPPAGSTYQLMSRLASRGQCNVSKGVLDSGMLKGSQCLHQPLIHAGGDLQLTRSQCFLPACHVPHKTTDVLLGIRRNSQSAQTNAGQNCSTQLDEPLAH